MKLPRIEHPRLIHIIILFTAPGGYCIEWRGIAQYSSKLHSQSKHERFRKAQFEDLLACQSEDYSPRELTIVKKDKFEKRRYWKRERRCSKDGGDTINLFFQGPHF